MSFLLCLQLLYRLGKNKVYLAGFDGFTSESSDYYDASYSFAGSAELHMQSNDKIRNGLKKMSGRMNIEFITPSVYQQ
ncbi:MAG: hypothetical protein J6N51_00345 [Selenomonas sp.]|nr:hypothetical protein [Selenomonas sp.]